MTPHHAFFSYWQDSEGHTLITCQGCNERHLFRLRYFATQWANAHATGRHSRMIGEVGSVA